MLLVILPVSSPDSPTSYTAHHAQSNSNHTKTLSTCGCIINGLPHVQCRQCICQPGSNNQKFFYCKILCHYASPCSGENTNCCRHILALYSFPASPPTPLLMERGDRPTPIYSPKALLLQVPVYSYQHAAIPM